MNRVEWTYQIRIRGTKPKRLPLQDLAEYISIFADLLGQKDNVHFAGIVSGSASIRARVDPERLPSTRLRLVEARLNPETEAGRAARKLERQLAKDSFDATVEDPVGVVLEFRPSAIPPARREHTIRDSGILDGVVVGIQGMDDSAHVRLLDISGEVYSAETRDMALAHTLAMNFRGKPLRLHVRGLWRRDPEGKWSPARVSIESYEFLDETPLVELLSHARAMPGSRWAEEEDPDAAWLELRN